jgi:hypothetical protein
MLDLKSLQGVKVLEVFSFVKPIHLIKFRNPEQTLRRFMPEAISNIALGCFVPRQ